jgi:hypothetical protein
MSARTFIRGDRQIVVPHVPVSHRLGCTANAQSPAPTCQSVRLAFILETLSSAGNLRRHVVKNLLAAALTTMALVSSTAIALAQQYGETVPIRRNYLGQLACPRDYVIQDNYCISIYSPGFRGDYGGALPQRRGYGYGAVTQPWVNQNGALQCPSDYVLDGANNCVSIYARRRYY